MAGGNELGGEAAVLLDETLDDLGQVLGLVGDWKLTRDEWSTVRSTLQRLRTALERQDEPSVEECVADLEEAAPPRLDPYRDPDAREAQPAPDEVRHIVIEIRRLAGSPPAS